MATFRDYNVFILTFVYSLSGGGASKFPFSFNQNMGIRFHRSPCPRPYLLLCLVCLCICCTSPPHSARIALVLSEDLLISYMWSGSSFSVLLCTLFSPWCVSPSHMVFLHLFLFHLIMLLEQMSLLFVE